MSQFIGAALPTNGYIERDDYRACDEETRDDEDLFLPRMLPQTYENFSEFTGFASPWWPCRGALLGDIGDSTPNNELGYVTRYGDNWTRAGANGRLAYIGYTRDENGNIVPGGTVMCFRTVDDSLQSKVTSDGNGFYQITTPYYEGHYLVVQLPTTPAKAGASINSILPG